MMIRVQQVRIKNGRSWLSTRISSTKPGQEYSVAVILVDLTSKNKSNIMGLNVAPIFGHLWSSV